MSYIEAKKPSMGEMTMITVVAVVALMALAYVVLKYVDEPLRKYLSK